MKQLVSKQVEKSTETTNNKDRRSGKGLVISLSRRIYHIQSKQNTYYVESESSDNNYYFVRYNPSVFEWCSCKDYENSKTAGRCKHLYAIDYSIRYVTIIEVDRLPIEVTIKKEKREDSTNKITSISESWVCDIYEW